MRPSDPTQFLQTLNEHRNAVLCHLIVGIQRDEYTNAPHPLALLRLRRERPCSGRAAEQRNELATFHSITSSAVASSLSGTVTPSIRAVAVLMTSSSLLACTTGKSAGFAPLRMRPA